MSSAAPTLTAPNAPASTTHGLTRAAMPDIALVERVERTVDTAAMNRRRAGSVLVAIAAVLLSAAGAVSIALDHSGSVLDDGAQFESLSR